MKYGYARISTKDQNLNMQIDALEQYGCQQIYSEQAKGANADRPKWLDLLSQIQSGDTLVVWKLDRMGRSLHHLIKIVNELMLKNVSIISLNDPCHWPDIMTHPLASKNGPLTLIYFFHFVILLCKFRYKIFAIRFSF